jgi:cobalt-zinc-cadmium efflux system membrane fusion protein
MVTRLKVLGSVLAVLVVFVVALWLSNWVGVVTHQPPAEVPRPKPEAPNVLRFAPGAPQLSSLRIEPVDEAPVPLAEPLSGRITYDENATARVASPIAGRVTRLPVEPGDLVKAGQPLLQLDAPDLAAAVAEVEKAGADEQRKRLAHERARTLVEGGVAPRKELEGAEADLRQAEADTRRVRQRLANLSRGERIDGAGGFPLRSPVAGVVIERRVNPGSEVRPDLPDPLFVISDPTRLWVLIDLPERSLSRVELGHDVSIEVDAWPRERFVGRIVRVGETIDPATRRVQVRASVPNPERKLKPEMYARVTLLADRTRTALRVPTSALITEGVTTFIFVEREPGLFEKRRLVPTVQDRENVYVTEGLQRGDRVVIVGALLLNAELRSTGG